MVVVVYTVLKIRPSLGERSYALSPVYGCVCVRARTHSLAYKREEKRYDKRAIFVETEFTENPLRLSAFQPLSRGVLWR